MRIYTNISHTHRILGIVQLYNIWQSELQRHIFSGTGRKFASRITASKIGMRTIRCPICGRCNWTCNVR